MATRPRRQHTPRGRAYRRRAFDAPDAALAAAIEERRSDRPAFRDEPIQPAQLDLLTEHAAAKGAGLIPVLTDDVRTRLAAVLGEAAASQRTPPGYAAEPTM